MKRSPKERREFSDKRSGTGKRRAEKGLYYKKGRARATLLIQSAMVGLGSQCVECGLDDMRCLQFDHIVPKCHTKSKNITTLARNMISHNKERLKQFWIEVAKCQLLCANCHAIKTRFENEEGMYKNK